MNRRTVLGAVAVSIGVAGCLGDDGGEASESPDENENEDENECSPTGMLEVYIAGTVPDEHEVRDADDDAFANSCVLSRALRNASRNATDETDPDTRLFHTSGEYLLAHPAIDDELGVGDTYIAYEDRTYLVRYDVSEC
ncbi:hypothetical protein [Halobiforma nitratireducens]|uniref:hypothetical protein n=1 Tax=Halobiforma nitratireducens TaxID=130048 RepID=UPI001267DA6F|nr:hypothetical protein [Halobiforma nitratireducens]